VALACGRTPVQRFGQASDSDSRGSGDDGETRDGTDGGNGPGHTATSVGDGTSSGEESGSTGMLSCIDAPELCSVQLSLRRAVDILFVIDNSGSMGGEQGTLAQSFASFIAVLEGLQVGANYRIGVTTTAGDGFLRATSCRSRLHEFIFTSQEFGDIDARQVGCLDHCSLDAIDVPDPWVEKSSGQTNLPAGVGMAEALQCVGPQGINGPGFERPLESMRNALRDNVQGFMRDDALLAVIFVTDEADCSMSDEMQGWIQTQGQVFWTTPDRATSAVCWNAGVTCTGGPGTYDDCVAVDKGQNGLPTGDPDAAVLFPVQRYVDTLTDIAEQKQLLGGQGEVLVALLGGVPLDYPQTGVVVYRDSVVPDFNMHYGIGPGCGVGTETIQDVPGIPPVRMRQFAEAFATEERNIFSVCSDDYGVALMQMADAIGELNERACVNGCVVDAAPGAPGLQPDCTLVQTFAEGSPDAAVPPCAIFDTGWEFPSEDDDVCYRALIDVDASTVPKADDMSAQCLTVGSNVEYAIERREGVPIPAGTSVEVKCQLLAPVGVTCDEI
jgi:hypothetical protein